MQKYIFVWEDAPAELEPDFIPLVKVADGYATKTGGGFDFAANYKAWLERYPNAGAWIYLYLDDTVKEITDVVSANCPADCIIVLDIEQTVLPNVIYPMVAALKEMGHPVWLSTFGLVGQAQTRQIPFSGMGFDVISPQIYYPYEAPGLEQWAGQGSKVIPTYSPKDWPGLELPTDTDYALWRFPDFGLQGTDNPPVDNPPVTHPITPTPQGDVDVALLPAITIGAGAHIPNQYVKNAQALLDAHGEHVNIDGVFGPATLAAVKNYQLRYGLHVDGIVGPVTWGSLVK